jgi:hypothetical protein
MTWQGMDRVAVDCGRIDHHPSELQQNQVDMSEGQIADMGVVVTLNYYPVHIALL